MSSVRGPKEISSPFPSSVFSLHMHGVSIIFGLPEAAQPSRERVSQLPRTARHNLRHVKMRGDFYVDHKCFFVPMTTISCGRGSGIDQTRSDSRCSVHLSATLILK